MTKTDPRDYYVVIGPYCWGRSKVKAEAISNCIFNMSRSESPTTGHIYKVTKESEVYGLGGITHPIAWPPILEGEIKLRVRG